MFARVFTVLEYCSRKLEGYSKEIFNFYDVSIFTQPFHAVCLKRLRENGDAIKLFVEYPSSLREQYSIFFCFDAFPELFWQLRGKTANTKGNDTKKMRKERKEEGVNEKKMRER